MDVRKSMAEALVLAKVTLDIELAISEYLEPDTPQDPRKTLERIMEIMDAVDAIGVAENIQAGSAGVPPMIEWPAPPRP